MFWSRFNVEVAEGGGCRWCAEKEEKEEKQSARSRGV